MGDFWVFGYGSLMWRPGFAHTHVERARLHGFRRALCVRSWVHRGTRTRPGLVLGLDRGGSCIGLAFRVPGDLRGEVIDYLRQRELVTRVYEERTLPVMLSSGDKVQALCYVVDRRHEQYAGRMDASHAAEMVMGTSGQSGPNDEYVFNTLEHLEALKIRDHWLEDVGNRLRTATASAMRDV